MYVNMCVRGQVVRGVVYASSLGVWMLPCHHLLSGMNFRYESSMQSYAFEMKYSFVKKYHRRRCWR